MKLNERQVNLFKNLNQSQTGKDLADYAEQVINELFNPEELTTDNLQGRKDAANFIRRHFIDRIKLSGKESSPVNPNDYI